MVLFKSLVGSLWSSSDGVSMSILDLGLELKSKSNGDTLVKKTSRVVVVDTVKWLLIKGAIQKYMRGL